MKRKVHLSDEQWKAIRLEFEAGQRSMTDLAREYGVSVSAISVKAERHSWVRNLLPGIRKRAATRIERDKAREAKVLTSLATSSSKLTKLQHAAEGIKDRLDELTVPMTEEQIIEINAAMHAQVKRDQRHSVSKARSISKALLIQLGLATDDSATMEQVIDALAQGDEESRKLLHSTFNKICNIHANVKTLSTLADALRGLVSLENEVFGISEKQSPTDALVDALKELAGGNNG